MRISENSIYIGYLQIILNYKGIIIKIKDRILLSDFYNAIQIFNNIYNKFDINSSNIRC